MEFHLKPAETSPQEIPAKKPLIIGYYNIPNFVTALSLLFTASACYFVFMKKVALGILCLIYTGIIDGIDGAIARKMHANADENTKKFGAELDSLTDAINYTVGPICIGFAMGFNSPVDLLIYWFYLVAASQRVTHFNIFSVPKRDGIIYYIGIPTPYATIILGWAYAFFILFSLPKIFIQLAYALTAFLFVLNIEIRDIRTIRWIVPFIQPIAITAIWIYIYYTKGI